MKTVESVQTKWGPWDSHGLKILKDGYAEARRDSKRTFFLDDQEVDTNFAKYLIQFLEGEGLRQCSCH